MPFSLKAYKTASIVCAIFGVLWLIVSTVYAWKIVYGVANKHVVYRTRRPILLIISIFLCCINMFVRSLNTYLIMNYYIPIAIYRDIATLFGFTTALSIVFSRIWLLWYDLKRVRMEQKYIITNCLQRSEETLSTMSSLFSKKNKSSKSKRVTELPKRKLSFIFRHSNIFGSSTKSTLIWLICAILAFIFSAIAHRVTHTFTLSSSILTLYVVLVMASFTYLLLWVWYCETRCCLCLCCRCSIEEELVLSNKIEDDKNDLSSILALNLYRSAFRDDWNIRYEITALYICICGTILLIFLIQRFIVSLDDEIYSDQWFFGTFMYLVQVSIFNSLSIMSQIFIPWYTYHKFIKFENRESQRNHESDIGLKEVLSHQRGFYAFLQQLVNEFSVENLIYLIEIWQFKYHNINHRSRKRSRSRADSRYTQTFEENEFSYWSYKVSIPFSVDASPNQTSSCFYNDILRKLPWHGLPIGRSMSSSNNNKMQFARILFNKYIVQHSYECINISGNVRDKIVDEWKELELWMDNTNNNNLTEFKSMNIDLELHGIKSAEDFEIRLHKLFDPSFTDVFHNLEYCLSRFRLTPEFRITSTETV